MNKIIGFILILAGLIGCSRSLQHKENDHAAKLEEAFINLPDSARSWVLWDWINCNVSREGITKDLESMKRVGVGGVVWRGLAGPWWAPGGPVTPYSNEWHDLMQWAIQEAERLDIV